MLLKIFILFIYLLNFRDYFVLKFANFRTYSNFSDSFALFLAIPHEISHFSHFFAFFRGRYIFCEKPTNFDNAPRRFAT